MCEYAQGVQGACLWGRARGRVPARAVRPVRVLPCGLLLGPPWHVQVEDTAHGHTLKSISVRVTRLD